MEFYLVELTVSDWSASLVWYRDRLGLAVELIDEANRYALLTAGAGRIALKAGVPMPGATKLVLRVSGLDPESARLKALGVEPSGPAKASVEGYRSTRFTDPDGYVIEVFEWTNGG